MKTANEVITIKGWKENRDGSATMKYELTEVGYLVFKKLASKKKRKFDKNFVNKEILNAIKLGIKENKA